MSAEQSQFFSSFTPLADSGRKVVIAVNQTLEGSGLTLTGPAAVTIEIEGPQVELTESEIAGVYPAPGSDDSPDEFLPHIALTRRTLPWERPGPGGLKPWLALLLVKDSELNPGADLQVARQVWQERGTRAYRRVVNHGPSVVVDVLANVMSRDPVGLGKVAGMLGVNAKVNLLFLSNPTLVAIRPAQEDLAYLCNVKRTKKDGRDIDCAIVISNRLPDASGANVESHTAFLVSLEGRDDFYDAARDGAAGEIGLVYLHSWSFKPSKGGDFEQVVRAIGIRPNGGVLRFGNLPADMPAGQTPPLSGGFAALLDQHGLFIDGVLDTLKGDGTYRSPLRPFPPEERSPGFAIRSAPEEFADAAEDEPQDYSHAAAFELGRLLALASQDLLEDLRKVKGVINPIDEEVLINQLPIALQKPEWVVNPAWNIDEPWSLVMNGKPEIMTKSPAELIGATPGDVGGINEQLEQLGASVIAELAALPAAVAAPITIFDLNTITAATLEKDFAHVVAKGQH